MMKTTPNIDAKSLIRLEPKLNVSFNKNIGERKKCEKAKAQIIGNKIFETEKEANK